MQRQVNEQLVALPFRVATLVAYSEWTFMRSEDGLQKQSGFCDVTRRFSAIASMGQPSEAEIDTPKERRIKR